MSVCPQVDDESVPSQYVIDIEGGGSHGQLGAGHLADHPSAVAALQGAVKVGQSLGPLMVLERVEVGCSPGYNSLHCLVCCAEMPGLCLFDLD